MVSPRVGDPLRRAQLRRFIDDAMALSERAGKIVQARYVAGRKALYTLASDLARVQRETQALLARVGGRDPHVHARAAAFALRHQASLEQAQAFVQDWMRRQADQPVFDVVHLDTTGTVVGDPVPIALFATFSREDEGLLVHYQHLLDEAAAELAALVHDLPGLEG
jgi:hypothetical protein